MNIRQAQLPEGWEIKKLGEICEIKPPKKEARQKLDDNDVVSFLPMEDLGVLERTVNAIKKRSLKEVSGSYTYFADNDVLLAKITPCFENGKLGIARNLINGIGFGSSEYIVFRSNGDVSEEYLFYFLSQEIFREEGRKNMTGAVGHKRVSKEFVENYEIPLPPLPEQQRIVSILDECFAAIDKAKANAEQNLKNVKELFESYLQGVFEKKGVGWKDKTLGEVCNVIGGGTPSKANSKYYDGDIYWATVRDMKGEVISDTEHKITKEAVKNSSTNIIPKGNVVIATRVGLGKVCLIENDTAINQDLRGVVPINPKKSIS
jgi:type I restriction enzyme S subunit